MKELVFSIEQIFQENHASGCLQQYGSQAYYIPAYQRGYKWSSEPQGPVTQLLHDLWDAFEKNKEEYFLQYITLKPLSKAKKKLTYLEVIDGQQRLTTLSILLQSFACLLHKPNPAHQKLVYAIRDNFFEKHIYPDLAYQALVKQSWDELIQTDSEFNKQDIYYLHSAARNCHGYAKDKSEKLEDWYQYILANVKIIVNGVEAHVQSETVFRNLNSNRVPLTEPELIKGLFITHLGRDKHNKKELPFQEINLIRAKLGRQWDEISAWANRPEIRSFYFDNATDGMYELLTLTGLCLGYKPPRSSKNSFPLFNHFSEQASVEPVFDKLVDLQLRLESWRQDTITYNLLGFIRHCKRKTKSLNRLYQLVQIQSREKLITHLEESRTEHLKNIEFDTLNFEDNHSLLHDIYLALSVFSQGHSAPFDFYRFQQQNWTLEHVFPQTPEGKGKKLKKRDIKVVLSLLGEEATKEIKDLLTKPEGTGAKKEVIQLAIKRTGKLDLPGNLCLLTKPDNTSNSNQFFYEKRQNILERIKKGSFIPSHTLEVFAKTFPKADTDDMKVWSVKDMEAHTSYIRQRLQDLSLVSSNRSPA